jgi:hypothetical protein
MRSVFDLVFHAVAGPLDDNNLGMMQQAIQHGGGNGAVIVKDRRPLFEGFVGGEDQGSTLITQADHLEEQIGPVLVNRQIADFIKNGARPSVAAKGRAEFS